MVTTVLVWVQSTQTRILYTTNTTRKAILFTNLSPRRKTVVTLFLLIKIPTSPMILPHHLQIQSLNLILLQPHRNQFPTKMIRLIATIPLTVWIQTALTAIPSATAPTIQFQHLHQMTKIANWAANLSSLRIRRWLLLSVLFFHFSSWLLFSIASGERRRKIIRNTPSSILNMTRLGHLGRLIIEKNKSKIYCKNRKIIINF